MHGAHNPDRRSDVSASPDVNIDFDAFAQYFQVPKGLLDAARDPGRTPRARLVTLGEMAASIDALFATHCDEFRRALATADTMVLAPTAITTRYVTPLLDQAAAELVDAVLPQLAAADLAMTEMARLSAAEQAALEIVFRRDFYPLLTPLAVDPAHPFPRLGHGDLNMLVQLRPYAGDSIMGGTLFAVLSIPRRLPRWIRVPESSHMAAARDTTTRYVWIEDLLTHFIGHFFNGIDIIHVYYFRVLRCKAGAQSGRIQGDIVRLDISAPVPLGVAAWLSNHLHLPAHTVVRNRPPLAMADLRTLVALLPTTPPWYQRAATRLWNIFFGHL